MPRLQNNPKAGRKRNPDEEDALSRCPVPVVECIKKGGLRMYCSNASCTISVNPIHPECFEALEDALIKYLRNTGSSRRWSDEKLKQNLWCKKGMNVIGRRLQCPCGKGVLDAREDFRVPDRALILKNSNKFVTDESDNANKKKQKAKGKTGFGASKIDHRTTEHYRDVDDYLSRFSDDDDPISSTDGAALPPFQRQVPVSRPPLKPNSSQISLVSQSRVGSSLPSKESLKASKIIVLSETKPTARINLPTPKPVGVSRPTTKFGQDQTIWSRFKTDDIEASSNEIVEVALDDGLVEAVNRHRKSETSKIIEEAASLDRMKIFDAMTQEAELEELVNEDEPPKQASTVRIVPGRNNTDWRTEFEHRLLSRLAEKPIEDVLLSYVPETERRARDLQCIYNMSDQFRTEELMAHNQDKTRPTLHENHVVKLPPHLRAELPIPPTPEKQFWYSCNYTQNDHSTWPAYNNHS